MELISFQISVKYTMVVSKDGKELCLDWDTILFYDLEIDGLITFSLINNVKACNNLISYFLINIFNGYDIFNSLILICAVLEVFVIMRRIYRGVKTLLRIRKHLNDQFISDNHIH